MNLPPGVHEDFPLDPLGTAIDLPALTPLFRQYVEIKQQYPQALLLYRLGDFYEMFGPDAVKVSRLLGLTLTARGCAKDYKVAMCGVPHHSAARYIKRLVAAGEVLAICEQTEDASEAKGLVERAVTRLITAGTLVEDEYLAEDRGNYLGAVAIRGSAASPVYSAALLESSGGQVELYEVGAGPDPPAALRPGADPPTTARLGQDPALQRIVEILLRARPAEILLPAGLRADEGFMALLRSGLSSALIQPALHSYESLPPEADCEGYLLRYFRLSSLAAFGLDGRPAAQAALFATARYLRETFKVGELKLYPRLQPLEGFLQLDPRTLAHLNVLPGGDEGAGAGPASLFELLCRQRTAPGKRRLRRLLASPFSRREEIEARHAAIEELLASRGLGQQIEPQLARLQDLERILGRLSLGRSNPKELRALADSLAPLGELGGLLRACGSAFLQSLGAQIGDFEALGALLSHSLSDDPPLRPSEGNVIRSGVDSRVDELRALAGGGAQWFRDYEAAQRERSGIRTLKVKHTDAFGWFIEIGKGSLAQVPADYQRRQTLVNAERFVTPELQAREADARDSGGRLLAREREIFESLCQQTLEHSGPIAQAMQAAAEADVLVSFAIVAREGSWVRPMLACDESPESRVPLESPESRVLSPGSETSSHEAGNPARTSATMLKAGNEDAATDSSSGLRTQDSGREQEGKEPASSSAVLEIVNGRHPLIEAQLGSRYYTPNDCYLDSERQQVMLLTGPNMGGKSSYLRMVALLCLLAQCGSFVPAESARLPLLRRIYTRVGAQDQLARGHSTFMVEMLETAEILATCGPGSLVILDEVGRGTSTYDGISIAKAVLEFLHEHSARPLTLFATHFFELTDLPLVLPRCANHQVEVLREGQSDAGSFVFTYRVIAGAASDSFGIDVAALAGLPESVVLRAREILAGLEEARRESRDRARQAVQLGLF
ncbi:hypothetical protein IT575_07965 [bacterium]|nr:hypothetical protein [bacterium]